MFNRHWNVIGAWLYQIHSLSQNLLSWSQQDKVDQFCKQKMCTDTANTTAAKTLNVLRWRNMKDKPVEKKVWCLLMAKTKSPQGTLPKKMAKFVFAKPQLKSAGHEEEYFKLCTGTVTVMHWHSHCDALDTLHALHVVASQTCIKTHPPYTKVQLQ